MFNTYNVINYHRVYQLNTNNLITFFTLPTNLSRFELESNKCSLPNLIFWETDWSNNWLTICQNLIIPEHCLYFNISLKRVAYSFTSLERHKELSFPCKKALRCMLQFSRWLSSPKYVFSLLTSIHFFYVSSENLVLLKTISRSWWFSLFSLPVCAWQRINIEREITCWSLVEIN